MDHHQEFQDRLDRLVSESKVAQEVIGEILARTARLAPDETTRMHLGQADPLAGRPGDRRLIPQPTVSRAVKSLMSEGLLEVGKSTITGGDGRRLQPVRLGRRFVIAGVDVELRGKEAPTHVTTALVGLDSTRVLADRRDEVPDKASDRWESAAQLICKQVTGLLGQLNRARMLVDEDSADFDLFGIGVGFAAPVDSGGVMLVSSDKAAPVDFAAILRKALTESKFRPSVPVLVENDVNALGRVSSTRGALQPSGPSGCQRL